MKVKFGRDDRAATGDPVSNRAGASGWRSISIALACGTDTEPTRWDPKDGDLCLTRLKPGETLVEDRSDSDVQIDRPSRV